MRVHEEILQQIVNDDYDEGSVDVRSRHARHHLDNLKRAHQRLGGWDKDASVYVELYDQLVDMFRGQSGWGGLQPIGKWPRKIGAHDDTGAFKQPASWEIWEPKPGAMGHQNWLRRVNGLQRWDSGMKSARGSLIGTGLHTFVENGQS